MKAIRWSDDQLASYERKRKPDVRPSLVGVDRLYRPSASKYGNEKTNGYDSKREAKRADLLKLMQEAGEIADLREQVKYELIPAQYVDGKCVERAWVYIADFQYRIVATGEIVTEDSKGCRTREYVSKRKAMLHFHGIRVQEV